MRNFLLLVKTLLLSAFLSGSAFAQTRANIEVKLGDPRGLPELTICSQNLDNYGTPMMMKQRKRGFTDYDYEEKEDALLSRFVKNKCDVIAVQEILSKDKATGVELLKDFALKLRKRTNRNFDVAASESNDPKLRLGFLAATDRGEILNRISYNQVELPKITTLQKQRMFSRGPFEIQMVVKGRDEAPAKQLSIINFHFKSKSTQGGTDPAGLEFEPVRIEMAEALRRIVEVRHGASFQTGKRLLVLVGDRNSNFDTASARVLEGQLTIANFQEDGVCRLSKRGVPLCKLNTVQPQELFSVLTSDPQTKRQKGTHLYAKVFSWIDDIIMPAESLSFAYRTMGVEGDYDSGIVNEFPKASDHAMTWVTLNW